MFWAWAVVPLDPVLSPWIQTWNWIQIIWFSLLRFSINFFALTFSWLLEELVQVINWDLPIIEHKKNIDKEKLLKSFKFTINVFHVGNIGYPRKWKIIPFHELNWHNDDGIILVINNIILSLSSRNDYRLAQVNYSKRTFQWLGHGLRSKL